MNLKKSLTVTGGIFFVLILIFVAIYSSPVGENLLKNYISSKLGLLKNFQIEKFNYKWNSFSVILKKGSNYISIYGDIFPFDATYEAKFNNLEEISNEFRGSIESQGNINYENYTIVSGNAIFADGYGDLKLQCNSSCVGIFNGKDFDIQKLLYMVKVNFPYLTGNNDLNIVVKKAVSDVYVNFKGKFNYKDIIVLPSTAILANLKIKNRNNFEMDLKNVSDNLILDLNYKKDPQKVVAKGKAVVNLSAFRKILLYPFVGRDEIRFYYDSIGDILKFEAGSYKGYYDGKINIQLNNLNLIRFFRYINIPKFAEGYINGDIVIGKKEGVFNIIVNNCLLDNTKIIKYISSKINRKISKLDVVFLKGEFDRNRVVFNILSKSKNLIVSIQNGVYFYNGKYRFNVEVIVDNNYKYVFSVSDKGIKLKKALRSYKVQQEILVY
jgi:hypothetical protein